MIAFWPFVAHSYDSEYRKAVSPPQDMEHRGIRSCFEVFKTCNLNRGNFADNLLGGAKKVVHTVGY